LGTGELPPPALAQAPRVMRGLARLSWATDGALQRVVAGILHACVGTVCLPHVRRAHDEAPLRALADGLAPADPADDAMYVPPRAWWRQRARESC
jgi:hypothetical protein